MIIFLTGLKGSGKNTAANFLEEAFRAKGWYTMQMAFADELRQHLEILDPILYSDSKQTETWQTAVEEYGYDEAKKVYPEMRRLMQRYGTQVVRERVDDNFWVDAMRRKIRTFLNGMSQKDAPWVVILTDCRFANEYYHLRDGSIGESRLLNVRRAGLESDGHESEDQAWLKGVVHAWLPNNGTLQDLKNNVELWVADVTS